MSDFERTASELVRDMRISSGLRQATLARRAGMSRSVLCAYESGARQPGVDALARIAAAVGMQLSLQPAVVPVDPDRAGRILEQVLDLAEALPYRPGRELKFPRLTERLA
ncbi:MAG: helix-turn-helix domain-containing protein [Solirubrobacterales bacterium]